MKTLTRSFIVIFACTGLALVAFAGPEALPRDSKDKEVMAAPLPPTINWTGFYLGMNAGYTWSDNNSVHTDSVDVFGNPALGAGPAFGVAAAALATFSLDNSNDGFIGGGQIGYNWQFAHFVAGMEADIQGVAGDNGSSTASSTLVAVVPGTGLIQTATVSRSVDYIGTARGRLGFLVTPRLLAYATGGLAYGGVSASTSITQMVTNAPLVPNPYSGTGSFSDTRVGWTFGGGLEWMFLSRWSVKAEYLYYDLGSVSYNVSPLNNFNTSGTLFTTTAPTSSANFNGHIIRGGLNFHF
jgi:outer membrane immunogenic protein